MSLKLAKLIDPDPNTIGNNVYEFMDFLAGPAEIFLSGEDSSRTRAFVTLLHGNEPSGIMALFRWLKSAQRPAVNIICIVASVEAANTSPQFNYRVIEPRRDLNRCFKSPFDDKQGQLAEAILNCLSAHQPEAAIDMHNTSGSGPAFGVATFIDKQHDALCSVFTQRLIVTSLQLGALMEISEHLCPTVTIECGGRLDEEAHQTAWEGLQRYFTQTNVLAGDKTDWGLELLQNPVRLELRPDCRLCYQEQVSKEHDLTLPPGIEHFNSGVTSKDTFLGWVQSGDLTDIFSSKNSHDHCVLDELVYIEQGQLFTRQDLKLFMVTTNPVIAKMDCLFYAVQSNGQEIIAK
jgi:hypothetical protein